MSLTLFYIQLCLKKSYLRRNIDPELYEEEDYEDILKKSSLNLMFFGVVMTACIGGVLTLLFSY